MKLLEFWGKKVKPKENKPLTAEDRALIKRIFPQTNADMKMPGRDEYVLPQNAHAHHGTARLSFYKDGDELRVSVAHHHSEQDAINPRAIPITHTDHAATEDELERLKRDLS